MTPSSDRPMDSPDSPLGGLSPADLLRQGAAEVTYERGLWFRTPEAYDERGDFRASVYLRPLAIWAIEEALARRSREAERRLAGQEHPRAGQDEAIDRQPEPRGGRQRGPQLGQ